MSQTDQTISKRPTATVIYAQVNRTGGRHSSPKKEKVLETVALDSPSKAKQKKNSHAIATSSPKGEENSILLLQTPKQEMTYHQQMVVGIPERSPLKKRLSKIRGISPVRKSKEEISYCISSYDNSMEYGQLDPQTLTLHYGKVTPYGTIAQENIETDGQSQNKHENRENPRSEFGHSSSKPFYSSLLHTSNEGTQIMRIGSKGISYVDFMPQKKKESCCKTKYLNFL